MSINLKGRNFLNLKAFTTAEIEYLLDLSEELKRKKRCNVKGHLLSGKNFCFISAKPSLRTRCSFEIASFDEGGYTTTLADNQLCRKESAEDMAKVLGTYYDGIGLQAFKQKTIKLIAKYATVPVWNGLSDLYHPFQILSDLLTIREHVRKPFYKIKLVFVGDTRNNVANSILVGATKMGIHFVAVGPESLSPDLGLVEEMKQVAKVTGAKIEITHEIDKVIQDADIIYTDTWCSMGEEDKFENRINLLRHYQVNQEMLEKTQNPHVLFMHCLPALHNVKTVISKAIHEKFGLTEMEVSDQVFHGKHSIVYEQAANRLHTIKAIMVATAGKE
jgi:ornithine carbamoyltransferase